MIVVVEITMVEAPPTSCWLTSRAAVAARSRSARAHGVDRRCRPRRDPAQSSTPSRCDLGAGQGFMHGGAIGVLFRDVIGEGRRDLGGWDECCPAAAAVDEDAMQRCER